jgi:hypothetical protein
MGLIDISTDGVDEQIARLRRIDANAPRAQAAEIRPVGTQYLATLRRHTPRRSGQLQDAYTTDETMTATSATFTIENTTPYIGFVVRGRGPVVATRAKALRFTIGGRVLFRMRVGPAKANPFVDRTIAAMATTVRGLAQRIADRIVNS